jgi:HD-like signal output (HDOD) protein
MKRSAEAISESLKKVPPFPPVAAKLLQLLANPSVDTNEVADLIGSDPTFMARLLQRANSAQFGFISDVTSARRAVALLGLDLTRQITLAHATAAYAGGALKTEALRRCWQHTVATAVLAEEIAIACEMFTSVAFTAGIMHDIGRLGLLVAYPDEYELVIRGAAERCLDLLDFEEETFGVHHAEAGRMLAERWGLPTDTAMIAGRHHDACEGIELDLLRIVHVACRLADVLGFDVVKPLAPSSADVVLAELPPHARQRLTQAPEELLKRIEQRISEFSSEKAEIQPEEALALLATAAAEHPPESSVSPESGASQDPSINPADAAEPEPVQSENRPNRSRAIVIGAVTALAAVAALAYWMLR